MYNVILLIYYNIIVNNYYVGKVDLIRNKNIKNEQDFFKIITK
jgi:hypothetical protein